MADKRLGGQSTRTYRPFAAGPGSDVGSSPSTRSRSDLTRSKPQFQEQSLSTPVVSTEDDSGQATPYSLLRNVAGVLNRPQTPVSASQLGGDKRNAPKPAITPNNLLRPVHTKRVPTTPHIKLALEQRQLATPGRKRRQSGRRRNTLRGDLRKLAKTLSKPSDINSTPKTDSRSSLGGRTASPVAKQVPIVDLDLTQDEHSLNSPPRPSTDFWGDTESDLDEIPMKPLPRLSLAPEDVSHVSIEQPLRATTELRSQRGSLGLGEDYGQILDNSAFPMDSPSLTFEAVAVPEEEQDASQYGRDFGDYSNQAFRPFEAVDHTHISSSLVGSERGPVDDDGHDESALRISAEVQGAMVRDSNKGVRLHRLLNDKTRASLPARVIKRLAQNHRTRGKSDHRNMVIGKEMLDALSTATEAYFEQVSVDLGAFAKHANRKTIEAADVMQLMRRQRVLGNQTTLFSRAQRHLPRELVQEIRMPLAKVTR